MLHRANTSLSVTAAAALRTLAAVGAFWFVATGCGLNIQTYTLGDISFQNREARIIIAESGSKDPPIGDNDLSTGGDEEETGGDLTEKCTLDQLATYRWDRIKGCDRVSTPACSQDGIFCCNFPDSCVPTACGWVACNTTASRQTRVCEGARNATRCPGVPCLGDGDCETGETCTFNYAGLTFCEKSATATTGLGG